MTDWGVDADHPRSLIMAVLDNGTQGNRVMAALEECGYVIVSIEPTLEAVAAWWRVKNGHRFADEPAPTDTSDFAAYRALIAAAKRDQ